MSTFSQIVDEIATELVRPDLVTSITSYLNQTIRDVHFSQLQREAFIRYDSNRLEATITTNASPYNWTIPSVSRFAQIEAIWSVALQKYLKPKSPSINMTRGIGSHVPDAYWYRSGPVIALVGVPSDSDVYISYYEFPRYLPYYIVADRPATYSLATESFTYLPAYDIDATTRQNAEDLTTNWLLLRWREVMKEGLRAKAWKRVGDIERAKMAYSQFETERQQIVAAESYTGTMFGGEL